MQNTVPVALRSLSTTCGPRARSIVTSPVLAGPLALHRSPGSIDAADFGEKPA
jgi:hypothetical protein